MHLQSGERAPLLQTRLPTLPSVDQQNLDTPQDGSATSAFRAALRGSKLVQVPEQTDEATEQLSSSDTSPHKPVSVVRRSRWMSRRPMLAAAVALLILLGITVPVLGAGFVTLPFGMAVHQTVITPTPLKPTGALAGAIPVSDSPTVTPSPTGTPKPKPPVVSTTPQPTAPPYSTDGPYSSSTPPPGYSSFAVTEPSPDPWGSFGQCTWWAQNKRPDENFLGLGAAANWASGARARGFTVTSTPAANATVAFAPGAQGASSAGHVSHVEQVLTGGWVLVSEMNFYWNGGGWGRVNYRYVHVGAGVWFIL